MANGLVYITEKDRRGLYTGESLLLCPSCATHYETGHGTQLTPHNVQGAECDWCGANCDPTIPALKLERGQWVLAS